MRNKLLSISLLAILWFESAYPQEFSVQSVIESYLSLDGGVTLQEELLEEVYFLYENPIQLNVATLEDLEKLFFVNHKILDEIINHRDKYGAFLTVYELAYVEGMDDETLNVLLPFIQIDPVIGETKSIGKSVKDSHIKILTRLDRQNVGNSNDVKQKSTSNEGSADHIFSRISIQDPSHIRIGLSFEKDAGEPFVINGSRKQYGFDHYSFHFMIENKGILKKIIFGDYKLLFGQGLIQGSGFYLGKGSEPVSCTMKRGQFLKPHTGSSEYGYLRGFAGLIHMNKIRMTLYSSHINEDVNIALSESGDSIPVIRSIDNTGLHLSTNDLEYKNFLSHYTLGMNADYSNVKKNLRFGITMQYDRFAKAIYPDQKIYNYFESRGRNFQNAGIHIQFRHNNLMLFGEGALSGGGGRAFVAGMIGNLSDYLELTLLIRDYGKKFQSYYGYGFGESGKAQNEKGVYWGARLSPVKNLKLSLFYDYFNFPWLRYQSYAPSEGNEFQARAEYRFSRSSSLNFQYKLEHKQRNARIDAKTIGMETAVKSFYRINWQYMQESGFRLSSRIQWSNYLWLKHFTRGICFVQDLGWGGEKFKVIGRFALFDTDDYINRQYVYENDVLYYFYIPAYFGKGIRNYLVINYKPRRWIKTWLKLARTHYIFHVTDGIIYPSHSKWDIRLQTQLRF